ncbi:MAG: methyltransferase domain-containing protein [Myxococcales bacterium]
MTEWDAGAYVQRSGLQQRMAVEVLALLTLEGDESVLDVGCGDGRITAAVARRVPRGRVVGVDASQRMVDFARAHLETDQPNLHFQRADARDLPFEAEFDLALSCNALHWIPDQETALAAMHRALKPRGRAQLRLVPAGERKSLEQVIEETRRSPRWESSFGGFSNPYLHKTPEDYAELARRSGFRVLQQQVSDKVWDFGSHEAFGAFGDVTFAAWTERLPDAERHAFVEDVLRRYRSVAMKREGEDNCFRFYQMDLALEVSSSR